MWALIKKELRASLTSLTGYLVIGTFLLITGLFLWLLDGEFNLLNYGYADLKPFFKLAPWVLLFLLAALTMRMVSEERNSGTIELLLTSPLSYRKVIGAKYLAVLLMLLLSLLPTIVYVISISQLALPGGNIDLAAIVGSYIGVFLIGSTFAAIGILASALSKNQLVSFIISVLISLLLYAGFDAIGSYSLFGSADYSIQKLGMTLHYRSMALGVIDSRDVIYFLSIILLFLSGAVIKLKPLDVKRKLRMTYLKQYMFVVVVLLAVNLISSKQWFRWDLTEDDRYSLSEISTGIVEDLEKDIVIKIYLEGDFPAGFRRLKDETEILLQEFEKINSKLSFVFVDPGYGLNMEQRELQFAELIKRGLTPTDLKVEENGEMSIKRIFPWAELIQGNRRVNVNLLKSRMGVPAEIQLNNSVQNLEYAFVDALRNISRKENVRIAYSYGKGEPEDLEISDGANALGQHYRVERFEWPDAHHTEPLLTQEELNQYDVLIVLKPQQGFTEMDKLLIDQYVMQGGKVCWALDATTADADSLSRDGRQLVMPNVLDVGDLLFKYGVRINYDLVTDLRCAPLKIAIGQVGPKTQYQDLPWVYTPVVLDDNKHSIVKNMDALWMRYASSIDTVKSPGLVKTPIVMSSSQAMLKGTPLQLDLQSLGTMPDETQFNKGPFAMGVLLEGEFSSLYKSRIRPFTPSNYKEQSTANKMLVFSDGDIFTNQLHQGRPLALGFDKWTNREYANKDLLLNSVNYLLDDTGLMKLRGKNITLRLQDRNKVRQERSFWSMLNILLPMGLLLLIALLAIGGRRKKYAM